MLMRSGLHLKIAAVGLAAVLGLDATPAAGGGGAVIGKVAGDLTERFGKAANPTTPPRSPDPKLDYNPPVYTPNGSQIWSNGHVAGARPPRRSLTATFNRAGADHPVSDSLTDLFKYLGRGN
ncbi:MAG: hypothetical protein AAF968_19400 [Pseudomonadota bacterium]